MHGFQFAPGLIAARQARLVGGGEEDKSGRLQLLQMRRGIMVDLKLIQCQWPDLVPTFNPDLVEHPVSFKKYTQFQAVRLCFGLFSRRGRKAIASSAASGRSEKGAGWFWTTRCDPVRESPGNGL